jgi:hypothetical protein
MRNILICFRIEKQRLAQKKKVLRARKRPLIEWQLD